MKYTKNQVLKASAYTATLTRALKSDSRLHCALDEENRAVYVTNGYFLVKLNTFEYDALVRPITQREAGNFVTDHNGETTPDKPLDMKKLLEDAAAQAAHELTPAPFMLEPKKKNKGTAKIACYYSAEADFVAGYNSEYAAIIDGYTRKAKDQNSGMVIFSGDEPIALILPIRLTDTPAIIRAVRAYFTEQADGSDETAAALERTRRELDAAREAAAKLEQERRTDEHAISEIKSYADSVQAQYTAAALELERTKERAENAEFCYSSAMDEITRLKAKVAELEQAAQQAPPAAPEAQPAADTAPAPADKAAALVEKLQALEGITATIKGAKTAAPVVWIDGDADAHKAELEQTGARYSAKRGAWYVKI